mgnify:CR=1 FL=1
MIKPEHHNALIDDLRKRTGLDIHRVSINKIDFLKDIAAVSYTHLRAHETVLDLVCRLLLEKKK